MRDNLVIVESPAKAKTIEKFLGENYTVKSSFGHIRDLAKKGISVDIEKGFAPKYEVPADKKAVVSELKKLAEQSKNVWLASDEDREGEAIAWHLAEVLDLDVNKTKRIVFHEITKNAILNAIENPRLVDMNLVNAQQARRILDRLVGFELSPLLWKKVRPQLSAGRVQSVAVKLIVEREREIIDFKSTSFYKVTALFSKADNAEHSFKAELNKRFNTKEEAFEFLSKNIGASYTIESVDKKPVKRTPAAPFTTSTLQQEASRKLGFPVNRTMSVAQRLYESGLITYMRTDSVNLSSQAQGAIVASIKEEYGAEYAYPRNYKTKSKGAQEAHEAIRPTYITNRQIEGSDQEKRLYELIWRRTVASQMADANLERTNVHIAINTTPEMFVATGEIIKFDGFLKLYIESSEDDQEQNDEALLPDMNIGDKVNYESMNATERFTQRPARYSEASLVKQLEELGIGRPSTYAPTITTIINRGYVVKESREGDIRKYTTLEIKNQKITECESSEKFGNDKNKLFPTDIGMVVTDYLSGNFPTILDYGFTAKVEKAFDDIADGNMDWHAMLDNFYSHFHEKVKDAEEEKSYAISSRLLGQDPASGRNIYARIGRFRPLVQLGDNDDEKKQYANLAAGQLIETITLQDALKLFVLPRNLGKYEDKDVVIGVGKFGPYVRFNSTFISLKKGIDDPYTVTLERAIELIEEKRKSDKEKVLKTFSENPDVKILNGRWGAYIAVGKENYKLPKDAEVSDISFEQVMEIVEKQKSAPAKRHTRGIKTVKTAKAVKNTTKKAAK